METHRAILAIVLSFIILIGWQYLSTGFGPKEETQVQVQEQSTQQDSASTSSTQTKQTAAPATSTAPPVQPPVAAQQPVVPTRPAKDVTVETDLYTAVITENGGILKSFVLNKHKETNEDDSPGKQLVMTSEEQGLPLKFSWGSAIGTEMFYEAEASDVQFKSGADQAELKLIATSNYGLEIEKKYVFKKDSYLIDLVVVVKNKSEHPLQGDPSLYQVNSPYQKKTAINRFLFSGPAFYLNNELNEIKSKEFEDGAISHKGDFDWVAYEGTYFMAGILPEKGKTSTFTMSGTEKLTTTKLTGEMDTISPGGEQVYSYRLFYGPKKLSMLQEIGYNLDKSVNFGWFDIIAKPTLKLLNVFYGFFKNYGVAIILVTIIFKAVFWPITQKGLKSMKNMQKLQPKMAKIKEKYKNDPAEMNREVMNLYKTYKVNPLGGCLPMLLQIPVFFALYKVLLQCIELRHAPFMLWITDLSAPDRLWLGFEIPYLGGFPVLTILMGASMFIQQKLTPTSADPTQARIMLLLPVVFTFMFLNFASGLVLYWFVNNLLSILQQQLINRGTSNPA